MSETLIIVNNKSDWAPYFPSENVITFDEYLGRSYLKKPSIEAEKHTRLRIINLCQSSRYLSEGYYCSLLAEARGHSVIPSVKTLNDLNQRSLYRLELGQLPSLLKNKKPPNDLKSSIQWFSFFGSTIEPEFSELARKLFEFFPCPLLQVSLIYKDKWLIDDIKIRSPHILDDDNETAFANALDEFSKKVWRKKRSQKQFRFDLAILVDPDEKLPPSDKQALKKFIGAGKSLGIDCEIITQKDYLRLPEYDGLFIRTTTSINHFSYRFAKKAELEGLVVIDDPTSILRCTNKIYLADLFRHNNIPAPKTELLHKHHLEALGSKKELVESLENTIGYPIVLKIPDGSFSIGVEKVENREELNSALKRLFQQSSLLLAQEYLYTDFDWRIGVLNNKAIYACRYYMVRNHWQIYLHGNKKTASGHFETLSINDAPKSVINAALKATRPIGNGFYGVDLKEKDGKGYVIEINDNPSIDSGVEDHFLGDELYQLIMGAFLQRMEARRKA